MNKTLVIEAVRKTITVDCAIEEAFRVFTTDVQSWWPTDGHSIHQGEVREIVFEEQEGGEVYEVSTDGEKAHWATVVAWEPPGRLVLAWNILERDPIATEVEVRFLADGDGTRVELEHRGWDALSVDASERRNSYDTGWGHVLAEYAAHGGSA
jgi:Activator of Hsp90 ATPase homolog 1-like protein